MSGIYSRLFIENKGGEAYFDVAVLAYEKCTIRTLHILDDGVEEVEITIEGLVVYATKYPTTVVIKVSELLKLGEVEQNLLVGYEQTPEGRREETEVPV